MPTWRFVESAAALAVGTDIASGVQGQTSPVPRIPERIAVVGSAAAGDAAVDIYLGDLYVGRFFNTTLGTVAPVESKDWLPLTPDMGLAPNEPIHIRIADASGTNPLQVWIQFRNLA